MDEVETPAKDNLLWISHNLSTINVGYYSTDTVTLDLLKRFYAAVAAGTAYIRIRGNHRYNGSIARVTESEYGAHMASPSANAYTYTRSNSFYYFNREAFTATFDERKTSFKAKLQDKMIEIEWLEGYTGPGEYVYTKPDSKPKVPIQVFTDQLGRDITVGAPCIYVDWSGKINFGKVSKISPRNVVYCTNYKGDKRSYENESRIRDPKECIILLTKDLNDQVIMMRLRTE